MLAPIALLAATLSLPAWFTEIPEPALRAPHTEYPTAKALGIPSGPEVAHEAGLQLTLQLESARSRPGARVAGS